MYTQTQAPSASDPHVDGAPTSVASTGGVPASTTPPAIDDDVLRRFYQSELEASSFRRIEDRVGVGRTTLAKFLQGSQPTRRIKRQLTAGYLDEDGMDQHRGALVRLVGNNVRMQEAATRALVDVYRTQGQATPSWLTRLQDRFAGHPRL